MLRRAVISSHRIASRGFRRYAAAAATSSQKRTLDKGQIDGPSSAEKSGSAAGNAPTPPPSTGSTPIVIGIGLAAVAGGAYYFRNELFGTQEDETPKEAAEPSSDQSAETKVEGVDGSAGNRVVTIHVPQSATPRVVEAPLVADHPAGGNRVSMDVPDEKYSVGDSLMQLQSQTEEDSSTTLKRAKEALKDSLDTYLLQDFDELSKTQLKARAIQLAKELEDRTKWEAVRLKEFLAMKEKETADKYLDLMQKQRLEFEDLLAKRLREQEETIIRKTNAALQEKDDTIDAVVKAAVDSQALSFEEEKKATVELMDKEINARYEASFAQKLAQEKSSLVEKLQNRTQSLETLSKKLKELESALEVSRNFESGSQKAHRLSAAALALAEKLETSKGAFFEVEAMKSVADGEGVIGSALSSLPATIASGVPTLTELQARFESVHQRSRQAALVPAGRIGLDGQLLGVMFSTLKYPPAPDDVAPEGAKDVSEFILAKARAYVQKGDLEGALNQLDKLQGQVAFTVSDWKKNAMDRLAIEKALKVIRMECALLNESMGGPTQSS